MWGCPDPHCSVPCLFPRQRHVPFIPAKPQTTPSGVCLQPVLQRGVGTCWPCWPCHVDFSVSVLASVEKYLQGFGLDPQIALGRVAVLTVWGLQVLASCTSLARAFSSLVHSLNME